MSLDNNVLGITTQYDQAVNYYIKLKEQMLDKVFDSFMLRSNHIDEQTKTTLQTTIEQATSLNYQGGLELSEKALNKVQKYADQVIKGLEKQSSPELSTLKQEIDAEKEILKDKSYKEKRAAYKDMIKKKSILMHSLLHPEKLWSSINTKTYGLKNGGIDASDIQNQIYSYLNFYAMQVLSDDFDSNYWNRSRIIAGYYREISEYQALSNILGKNAVHHAGAKKIKTNQGNVDSALDIMISLLETEEQRLNNVQHINQLFEDEALTESSAKAFADQIAVYGEQVKSWSFQKNLPSGGYSIGNRMDLLKGYLQEGGNPYDYRRATAYLGRLRSILLALGPQNVLFSTGNQRFWMDDFIRTFREQSLMLTFEPNPEKDISQKIILDRLFMMRGKIVQMRKKYS